MIKNRRAVEALEVQLTDMAKSIHALLGDHPNTARSDRPRLAAGEEASAYDSKKRDQ